MLAKGLGSWDVSGVGVGCESFRIAVICQWRPTSAWYGRRDEQATERLGAGSVYFVRFGSGEAGRLGTSWTGCGVDSLAMATIHHAANRVRNACGSGGELSLSISPNRPRPRFDA